MSIAEKLTQIAENEQRVFEAGRKAEHNEFWDVFQGNGERKNYSYAFAYSWNDISFKPKHNMIPTKCDSMFNSCTISNIAESLEKSGVYLDTSQSTGMNYMFGNNYSLVRVPPISVESCSAPAGIFGWCSVETIDKFILRADGTNTFNDTFTYASNLKNITIEGVIGNNISFQYSTVLSKASIENIVAHLSDTASGKTLSLSKTAVNNAFTDAEWTALADTKKNWTISLA